jgi:hypothetical protein
MAEASGKRVAAGNMEGRIFYRFEQKTSREEQFSFSALKKIHLGIDTGGPYD